MKQELFFEKVAEKSGVSKKVTSEVLKAAFETILQSTNEGEKVRIAKFGTFEQRERNARRGRNPQTGEEITIEASKYLAYKPSKNIKEQLNQ